MTTVVIRVKIQVDLVGLVDAAHSGFYLPQVLFGDIVADSSKFTLDGNALVVVRSGFDGRERSTTLRVCVVVVVVPVAGAVVVPTSRSVDKPCRVKRLDAVREVELWVVVCDLAPSLVVDDPSVNAGVVLVLLDENVELAFPVSLLLCIWCSKRHRRHVLDEQ